MKIVKNYIKTKPRLYDFFNAIRGIDDELSLWIDNYSKSVNKPVNFIQVGANDGLRWDPFRRFILRDHWNGVLIEPLKPVYNMLRSNYSYVKKSNLKFENFVISEREGTVKFWSYTDQFLDSLSMEDQMYYLRQSSLDRFQVEKTLSNVKNKEDCIVCYETRSLPLESIIQQYFSGKVIDLICIDAEGFDDEVIRSINIQKYHPKAIIYESHNLGERAESIVKYLFKMGYAVNRIGGDTVAVLKPDN